LCSVWLPVLVDWHIHSWRTKDQLHVTCYFYFTSYVLNMFRTWIYPSSGACDYSAELPHWSYCSWFDVCCRFGVVGLEWCQQNSPKLLMMDIWMSETCWAHKKWNKNSKWHQVGFSFFNYHYARSNIYKTDIYTSFISGVIILICSLTIIVFSSSAISCEWELFKCFDVDFGAF